MVKAEMKIVNSVPLYGYFFVNYDKLSHFYTIVAFSFNACDELSSSWKWIHSIMDNQKCQKTECECIAKYFTQL